VSKYAKIGENKEIFPWEAGFFLLMQTKEKSLRDIRNLKSPKKEGPTGTKLLNFANFGASCHTVKTRASEPYC